MPEDRRPIGGGARQRRDEGNQTDEGQASETFGGPQQPNATADTAEDFVLGFPYAVANGQEQQGGGAGQGAASLEGNPDRPYVLGVQTDAPNGDPPAMLNNKYPETNDTANSADELGGMNDWLEQITDPNEPESFTGDVITLDV
jgi:hypothetical protein